MLSTIRSMIGAWLRLLEILGIFTFQHSSKLRGKDEQRHNSSVLAMASDSFLMREGKLELQA